ncbi:MAG: hypothetical protein NT162_02980 [Candidatus Woesebacteria bacterium]|nr:hypothetical protein [Candidatus Woesebacteria bacterium]
MGRLLIALVLSEKNYIQTWGKDDLDIKKQLGFDYRFFGVFLEKSKWKILLEHPFLSFGMVFLRILVGFNYFFININEKAGGS